MSRISLAFIAVILAFTLMSCEKETKMNTLTIIDAYQREVSYKENSSRYVCIGTGTLRLYTYIADVNNIVGIENVEYTWGSIGRPYSLLFDNLGDLPIIGNGGPSATIDAEKILVSNPDVIFISDFFDIDAVNLLQETTNIPVIVVSYNDIAGDIFNEVLYKSLEIIGEVTGNTTRSAEVVAYMKNTKEDLINRTSTIETQEDIYIGGQAYKGKHGIESTSGDYKTFDILNMNNIVLEAGITNHVIVDKEQVLQWNPDSIVMDANGYQLFLEDYSNNKEFYEQLNAFKTNQVYLQMPFNYYSTNIEIALANAYYIGSMVYPDSFTDVNPIEKYNEISMFFLGIETYDNIKADYYGGFQVIELSNK